jgi:hypothetical protein
MNEEALDQMFGWFHHFADLPREQLAAQATAANRTALSALIDACLPETPALDTLAPEEFADYVLGLRANERQWNQALGSALNHAEDLFQSEGKSAAASALHTFADSCPWSLFRDVAHNQVAFYVRRP